MILMIRLLEIAVGYYFSEQAALTSRPLGAITGARAKKGTIEDAAADVAAQAFCATIVASFRTTKKSALPFAGIVVVATARCTRVATIKQSAGL